jgi:hypothetical protein
MLAVTDTGLRRLVEAHNVDREIVCDSIEGNVLFDYDSLSMSDGIDSLCDSGACRGQAEFFGLFLHAKSGTESHQVSPRPRSTPQPARESVGQVGDSLRA